MYKLLIDTDALIKLVYSEIIIKVCETFDCLITEEVKEEAVTEGKKRFYPDAITIEELIKNNSLKVKEPKRKLKIKEKFGRGEISVLALYHTTKSRTIITDDSAFIKYLESNGLPFFIPSDLIILLKQLNKISKKEAMNYLDNMRVFIKEDVYTETKKEIKED